MQSLFASPSGILFTSLIFLYDKSVFHVKKIEGVLVLIRSVNEFFQSQLF